MQVKSSFHFGTSVPETVTYDEPSICPLCKHAVKPECFNIQSYKNEKNKWFVAATYLCQHCYEIFVVLYQKEVHNECTVLYIGPTRFKAEEFDEALSTLSPQFVKIYNQALAAETSGLDEIAGIGYRKALEFLVKDFLIHETPADCETIKNMELANCIANKVKYEKIKTVAARAAWLGNDQTHYVQRFEDRDIEDLKRFIKAVVFWISTELVTEDALSIERRDR